MAETSNKLTGEVENFRDEWISRLNDLVVDVEGWAEELGWATKRIEMTKQDSLIGTYQAPALLMQKEAARVLLEPIARSSPGYDWSRRSLPDAGLRRHRKSFVSR
ncbi:hypothetical protein BH23PLA1_BH23PLA1_41690 [soil metagenome]